MTSRSALILSIALLLVSCGESGPYDADADATADIAAGIVRATVDDKLVLLTFGANWCDDCRKLGEDFKKLPLRDVLAENFVVVTVEIGDFDANLDVAEKYGNPIELGIPAIAVIDKNDRLLLASNAGELANALSMPEAEVLDYFRSITVAVAARAPAGQ